MSSHGIIPEKFGLSVERYIFFMNMSAKSKTKFENMFRRSSGAYVVLILEKDKTNKI
jgi:hypothetical protein